MIKLLILNMKGINKNHHKDWIILQRFKKMVWNKIIKMEKVACMFFLKIQGFKVLFYYNYLLC